MAAKPTRGASLISASRFQQNGAGEASRWETVFTAPLKWLQQRRGIIIFIASTFLLADFFRGIFLDGSPTLWVVKSVILMMPEVEQP